MQSAPMSGGPPSDPEDTADLADTPLLLCFRSFLPFLASIGWLLRTKKVILGGGGEIEPYFATYQIMRN